MTSFESLYDAKTNPKCLQNNTVPLELICRSIEAVRCLINMAKETRNIKFVCDFAIKTITLLKNIMIFKLQNKTNFLCDLLYHAWLYV